MTKVTAVLPFLLLLMPSCRENRLTRLTSGQLSEHSVQGHTTETITYHHQGQPVDRDDHVQSRASSSSSSCPPLGNYVKCHDVVVLDFEGLSYDTIYRRLGLPITLTAFGRRFRLNLKIDILNPEKTWSSVIAPFAVVSVVGENGNVSEYHKHELGVAWYAGYDEFEVAPSTVQASIVNSNGRQLFRAIVRTTSDVYYIEPAADYPEVERAFY